MSWTEAFDREINARFPSLEVRREEPMAEHTSFRIGGPARRMAFPRSTGELTALLELAEGLDVRTVLLGNGSNLLVADEGLDALVVSTAGLNRLEDGTEAHTLTAEAGVTLARLSVFAAGRGLTGLEFAQGIPGTVGGALVMNAGAYGGEMSQVVAGAALYLPGEGVRFLTGKEMAFGYRRSVLTGRPGAAALYAVFQLMPGEPDAIRETMRDYAARRREKQPLEYPSAGSFFKRPPGHFAGALIENCGLKGISVGGARVSEKHAGFLINTGNATCADVLALVEKVRDTVREKTGVELEPEVKLLR